MIDNLGKDKHGLFYLTKSVIEDAVDNEMAIYNPDLLLTPQAIDIEHFLEFHLGVDVDYKKLSNDHSCYGAFIYNSGKLTVYDDNDSPKEILVKEKTVILDPETERIGRHFTRFTLSHEGGHCFTQFNALHKCDQSNIAYDYYSESIENDVGYRDLSYGKKRRLVTKHDWMEWQANYAGGCILMPRKAVLRLLYDTLGIKVEYDTGFADDFTAFQYLLAWSAIAQTFDVSDQAARIRLDELSSSKQ